MLQAGQRVVDPTCREQLPNDLGLLKDMVLDLASFNDKLTQTNQELTQKVAWFQRALWGKKSERLTETQTDDGPQTSLFDNDQVEAEARAASAEEAETSKGDKSKSKGKNDEKPVKMPGKKDKPKTRRGGKRSKKRGRFQGGTVPPGTPIRTRTFNLDGCLCSTCGGPLRSIGTDKRQRVEYIPGHFIVDETVVESGVCASGANHGIVTAEGSTYALSGSVLGSTLLCKIIVDKFADNIPLNRQSKRFGRKGVNLGSSTLSRSVGAAADLLVHVVDAMHDELLDSTWLQGDGTGLPVIIGDRNHAHRATLWVYSNGESAVFDVSMTKHGDFPAEFLKGFEGVWLSDGASDYNLAASAEGVQRAGCWSHGRRYLFEARNDDPAVGAALIMVRDLFMTERTAMLLQGNERQAHRDQHARPLVEKLRKWIVEQKGCDQIVHRPRSLFAKAVGYLDRQWARLTLFLDHPEIVIHNNRSELLLRTPVIGRRNWLFAGSPQGAVASTIHYSIVATCMMLGIDPMDYLEDVLPRLPSMKTTQVKNWTPAKWAERQRLAACGEHEGS